VALTPVNQDFNVNNGLVVSGTSAVTSSTEQSNALQVNSGAAIAQNIIVGTTATVVGELQVYNTSSLQDVIVTGTLAVASTSSLHDVVVDGNLNVTGEITADKLTIQYTTVTTTFVTTDDIISTYNPTNSTSTDTGALVVGGGVGVGLDVTVGGNISAGTITSTGAVTAPSFIGTATTTTNLEGGDFGSVPYQTTSGVTTFLPLGIDGTILTVINQSLSWASSNAASVGNATTASNIANGTPGAIPFQSDTGQTTFDPTNLKYVSSLTQFVANNIFVTNTASANSLGDGALSVAGGAYFGKDVYFNGAGVTLNGKVDIGKVVTILDYTNASSTGTGALVLSNGGAYISQNLYIGGVLTATNAQFSGLGNSQLVYTDGSGQLKNTVVSYSTETSRLSGTITNALLATTATFATTASFATTSGYALSFNTNTVVTTAVNAFTATFATTSGYTLSFNTNTTVTNAVNAINAFTATFANTSNFTINAFTATFANTSNYAVNILGGSYGSVLLQTATNQTVSLPIGGEGTILAVVNGLVGWGNPSGFTVNTATNFNGGVPGAIPFQAAAGATVFDDGHFNYTFPYTPQALLSVYNLAVNSPTASFNSTTGALKVVGGIGVQGDIYAGGTIYSNGERVLTGTSSSGYVSGLAAGAGINISSSTGVVTISNTGVLSAIGSTYIGVNTSTGNVTFTNLGVQTLTGSTYIGVSTSTGSVTVVNLGVQTLTAGTDTAVSSSTGTVTVWNTSTLQTVTSRGSSTNQAITITNNTSATSTQSGALRVVGGVGVGQDLYVGGNTFVSGNILPTTSTLSLGTLANPFADLYLGSNSLNIDTVKFTGVGSTLTITVIPTPPIYAVIPATLSIANILATGVTNSTSTNSGALQVAGGVGIGKDMIVGGSIRIANTLSVFSTLSSTTTIFQNALYVAGGVGIGKTLLVTGEAVFQNNVTFNGTTTYVLSTNTVYTDNIIELHYPNNPPGNLWTGNDNNDNRDDFYFLFGLYSFFSHLLLVILLATTFSKSSFYENNNY
jgi:hypothetical protein